MFSFKLKFLFFILTAVLGLAAFYLFSHQENRIEINFEKLTSETKNISSGEANRDSDSDGLMDWEEKIYGTDPYNPDTDGDGYPDGKEIANGYNPLVKAPGDKLADFPLAPTSPQNDPSNLTDRMITALVQKIAELNKNRQDNRQGIRVPKIVEFVPQFIKQNLSDEEYNFSANQDLKTEEIKISKDNSKKAVRKYLKSFKLIIDKYLSFSEKPVKNIIRNAYKSGDFGEFDNLIMAYDLAIKEFYALEVPSGWAELHKEEIKLLISTKKVLEALRWPEKDYLKAQIAIRAYYLIAFRSFDLKEKINSKVANEKIWL